MRWIELHTSIPCIFSGRSKPFDQARYVIFGVPFDGSSSFRSGSRFAPGAIREASLNIETYNMHSHIDVEDLALCDIGDLHVLESTEETLRRIGLVVTDLRSAGKTPVMMGGEHTITLGAVNAIQEDLAVISFDAHADLRSEYLGNKLTHATFMRRIAEMLEPDRIVEIGIRALCKEEQAYLERAGLTYFSADQIMDMTPREAAETVKHALSSFKNLYVTFDADVFDPAFAPGVGNPEPSGLTPRHVFSIIDAICDRRVVCLDLVEVTPHYDQGISAILAARTLFEALCSIEASDISRSVAPNDIEKLDGE